MKEKILLGALALAGVLGLSGVALAQVYPSPTSTTPITPTTTARVPPVAPAPTNTVSTTPLTTGPMPSVVEVDNSGNVLLRGVVLSNSGNALTVSGWGGTWTIQSNDLTQVVSTNANSSGSFSGINVGDFVGASGTIATTPNWTVDASLVHDWTTMPSTSLSSSAAASSGLGSSDTTTGGSGTAPASGSTTSSTPSSLPAGDTLYTGTVSNVGDSSITFTDASGTSQTANIGTQTSVWNTAGSDIPLSSIQANDKIRMDASVGADGTTLNADVVRDTSQ